MRRDKTDEYELRLDVGETKARLPFSDTIERLICERDEARSFAAHYVKSLTAEAEARGYRKGVEDAAKVMSDEYGARSCAAAILALLEQTEPGAMK